MRWLKKEACGKQIFFCMVGFLVLALVWSFVALISMNSLGIEIPAVNRSGEEMSILTLSFPFMLFIGVFCEEILFRFPLAMLVEKGVSSTKLLLGAFLLSIIFGLLHGGVSHVFIQGIVGFMFCILFLKCGGLQKKPLKAILITTTTHFLLDIVFVGMILISGGHSI